MNLSKKILKAINEGVLRALSFDDELPDTLDVRMHRISNDTISNGLDKDLEKIFYSSKLQEMMPNPDDIMHVHLDDIYDFVVTAIQYHKEYGATYNPHLDEMDFLRFIWQCVIHTTYDIDLNWVDTSEVTNMKMLFNSITEWNGDISEWDVHNVKDMLWMFKDSSFNGNISNWDVSHVTNMQGMFKNSNFSGNISNWNISSLTDTRDMFKNDNVFDCDLSSWILSNPDYSYGMLSGCPISDDHLPLPNPNSSRFALIKDWQKFLRGK